jgi:hypothetical protein
MHQELETWNRKNEQLKMEQILMPKVIASYYGYQKWEGYMPLYNAPV